MRRYASIDFLRGLAIFLMLNLHTVMHMLDIDALVAIIDQIQIIQILAFIVLPYMGGLAGFFLITSAIGNQISMVRTLEAGKKVGQLVVKQVVGGLILLVFAMLTEGVIGYQGDLGDFFSMYMDNPWNFELNKTYYRIFHFETIHTIAWCIIANGITQGILAKIVGFQNTKKMIKMYALLAVIILAMTPLMWWLVDLMWPGFPYEGVGYPDIRTAPAIEFVKWFFLAPIAGHPEPLFPYLASSFIGSIIGIYMSQDPKKLDYGFLKTLMRIGIIMFFVGTLGIILNLVLMLLNSGFNIDLVLSRYQRIWDHRYWTANNDYPVVGWLWQFLSLNGFGMMVTLSFIRLVEFRGHGKQFAHKTRFIRRFGFVAFSVYNMQWIYFIIRWYVSRYVYLIPGAETYSVTFGWGGVAIIMAMNISILWAVLLGWEKIGYAGSLEYFIALIAMIFMPGRRKTKDGKKVNIFKSALLDTQNAFYDAEWLNIVEKEDLDHQNKVESHLSQRLGRVGILFLPFAIYAVIIAQKSKKTEGNNRRNKKGFVLGVIGIVFFCIWVPLSLMFSLESFGISL